MHCLTEVESSIYYYKYKSSPNLHKVQYICKLRSKNLKFVIRISLEKFLQVTSSPTTGKSGKMFLVKYFYSEVEWLMLPALEIYVNKKERATPTWLLSEDIAGVGRSWWK